MRPDPATFGTRLRRDFDAAAGSYNRHAVLQREAARLLVKAVSLPFSTDALLLDLGCGTGFLARAIEEKSYRGRLLQIDLAEAMCQAASRIAPVLCADACRLPFAGASFDGVVSSLCLQWTLDPARFFASAARVLKPGGSLGIATLGPDSLSELRAAMDISGVPAFLPEYPAAAILEEQLRRAGFRAVRIEAKTLATAYADAADFLRHFRRIGAQSKSGVPGLSDLRRILRAYPRSVDGVEASYEVLVITANRAG